MTVDDAIAILNEFCHVGFNDWIDGYGGVVPASEEDGADEDLYILSGFEAIAVAREYERQAGRDMPATRLMVRRLKMCAIDDVTMQAKVAEAMSRHEINAAAEWFDQPNPSTETDA